MQNDVDKGGSEPDGEGGEVTVNTEFIGTALEHMQLDECTEWDHLTPEQQTAFIKAVEDGKLADIVEPWQPWWTVAGAVLENKDNEPSPGGEVARAAAEGAAAPAKSAVSDEDFLSQMFSAGEQSGAAARNGSACS